RPRTRLPPCPTRRSSDLASSMIATARRIANTITGMCSAMPTAVMTESRENTMTITAICAITTQNTCELLVVRGSSSWPPVISSRISIAPLTSRKPPPSTRIRSRTEMPIPPSWNRSVCIRDRNASETSSAMRVMQATAMPNLRAKARWCSGRRPTAIEMNTRLSMPSTISSALRVTRVNQTFGSARNSRFMEGKSYGSSGIQQARAQHQGPARHVVEHQRERGRRSPVQGTPSQLVEFGAIALGHRLDGGIEQFGGQDQQHRAEQQGALDAVVAQPHGQRAQDHQQADLQPERGLVQPGGGQAPGGPAGGPQAPARR